jgi:hypothetical protein
MGNEAIALGLGALYLLSKGMVGDKPPEPDPPVNNCDELNQIRDEKITYAERECNNDGGYFYFTTGEDCGSYTSRCVICPHNYHHDPLTQGCELDQPPQNQPCTAGQHRDSNSGLCVDVPPSQSGCTPGCEEDFYGNCICHGVPTKEPEPEISSCPNTCVEVAGECYCHPDPDEPTTPTVTPDKPEYPGDDPYDIDDVYVPPTPRQTYIPAHDGLYE